MPIVWTGLWNIYSCLLHFMNLTFLKLPKRLSDLCSCLFLQTLSEEVEENGSAIEAVKSSGAALTSHGTLYHDKLDPELRDITSRWQAIKEQVQVRNT